MGTLIDRGSVIRRFFAEWREFGLQRVVGPTDREVLFLLDGVGGFQADALMVRRALRQLHAPIGTVLFRWQCRPHGRVLSDLMWHSRNRRKAAELADELLRFRDEHPNTVVHLMAYSGGCGVAVFACECLPRRRLLDTLILACPAISPEYDLRPALQTVNRCYALVSRRDSWILGWGTRIFGTTDRRHTQAAGMVGFQVPRRTEPRPLQQIASTTLSAPPGPRNVATGEAKRNPWSAYEIHPPTPAGVEEPGKCRPPGLLDAIPWLGRGPAAVEPAAFPPLQGGIQGGFDLDVRDAASPPKPLVREPLVRESILAPDYHDASDAVRSGYEHFFQIQWSPDLIALGHHGGHTGWASTAFLREHLVPLLRGEPKLPVAHYSDEDGAPACRAGAR